MKEKIEFILEKACKKIYKQDKCLINNCANERAIVFRLGIYIQRLMSRDTELKFYNLDNEYNRNGQEPKRIQGFENGTYPDLIIHKRESNKNNMSIIECKTEWNDDIHKDMQKIREFINTTGKYKYKYGVSIVFRRNSVEIRILEYGVEDVFKSINMNCREEK